MARKEPPKTRKNSTGSSTGLRMVLGPPNQSVKYHSSWGIEYYESSDLSDGENYPPPNATLVHLMRLKIKTLKKQTLSK